MTPSGISAMRPRMNSMTAWAREIAAIDSLGDRRVLAGLRIDDLRRRIDHQDEIVVDQRAEPRAQPRLHHGRRLVDVAGADGRRSIAHHILEPEQRPFAVIDDGPGQELPLAFQRDVVGALSRGQRGDDDADDGDRDDDAKRNEHAEARPIPAGRFRSALARRAAARMPRLTQSAPRLLSWITAAYAAIIAIGLRIALLVACRAQAAPHFAPRR